MAKGDIQMRQTRILMTWCAAGLVMALPAAARSDDGSNPLSSKTKDQQQQQQAAAQQPALQQASVQEFFKASDLMGKATQDSKGTKTGEIVEIAFNQQGEVFAFVDVGNGKWAAIPWKVVNPATAKGKGNVTLNATDQQMKAGPAVTKNQWGSINNPKFVEGCYAYYNVQSPSAASATGGGSPPSGSMQGSGQSGSHSDTNSSGSSQSQTNSSSK